MATAAYIPEKRLVLPGFPQVIETRTPKHWITTAQSAHRRQSSRSVGCGAERQPQTYNKEKATNTTTQQMQLCPALSTTDLTSTSNLRELTRRVPTRKTPKPISQQPLIPLPTNLHIHHNPQPAHFRSKPSHRIFPYIIQIWIAHREEIRAGFSCEVFYSGENYGGGCEADTEAEERGVEGLEFLAKASKGCEERDRDDGQDGEDDGDEDEEQEVKFCRSEGMGEGHVQDVEGVEIGVDI